MLSTLSFWCVLYFKKLKAVSTDYYAICLYENYLLISLSTLTSLNLLIEFLDDIRRGGRNFFFFFSSSNYFVALLISCFLFFSNRDKKNKKKIQFNTIKKIQKYLQLSSTTCQAVFPNSLSEGWLSTSCKTVCPFSLSQCWGLLTSSP